LSETAKNPTNRIGGAFPENSGQLSGKISIGKILLFSNLKNIFVLENCTREDVENRDVGFVFYVHFRAGSRDRGILFKVELD